jgi:hypothetical protein
MGIFRMPKRIPVERQGFTARMRIKFNQMLARHSLKRSQTLPPNTIRTYFIVWKMNLNLKVFIAFAKQVGAFKDELIC